MKLKFICLVLVSVIFFSCSSEDEKSEQFTFLEFEKDVMLPAVNSHDISFLALNFDNNVSHWDFKLTDNDGNAVPVEAINVERTITSIGDINVQRINFKAHPKSEGLYTLVIKNTITNQLYTDYFLVESGVFNEMEYSYPSSYTLNANNQEKPTADYLYFQNIKNTITSNLLTTGIKSVTLQDKKTLKEYNLDFSVNAQTKKIEFVISTGVPEGNYFLSVRYNNLINNYFEKDIVVQAEKLPKLSSINKNIFQGGETLILKGLNFNYNINEEYIPSLNNRYNIVTTALIFTDKYKAGEIFLYAESKTSNKNINAAGTEINYVIPKNTGIDDFFFVSDQSATFFEGTVAVRVGPYTSEALPIRVNLK
ncbi:hypothetical protein [Flavobacterium panacagri]|uniref:hypothetical protein n=1 Tax=Flavobacterium panacagri TaxID=3034146 RepID=UPI0025A661D6|nr:hypothetical protein [Flavobacterium panacagri]